jgi:hypothetical protein
MPDPNHIPIKRQVNPPPTDQLLGADAGGQCSAGPVRVRTAITNDRFSGCVCSQTSSAMRTSEWENEPKSESRVRGGDRRVIRERTPNANDSDRCLILSPSGFAETVYPRGRSNGSTGNVAEYEAHPRRDYHCRHVAVILD